MKKEETQFNWKVDNVTIDRSLSTEERPIVRAEMIGAPNSCFNMYDIMNSLKNIRAMLKISSTQIEKVIFNEPATIILWKDGTKTVVKCQDGDEFNKEVGFITCYLKKLLGNDNTFNKEIAKWVPQEERTPIKLGFLSNIYKAYELLLDVTDYGKKKPTKSQALCAIDEAIGFLGEALDD